MSKPSRVQTFSENTFSPVTWLATGISVGLHVLLWVVQPALPSGSTSANNSRTVGFMQLTPEELSRLPEYSLPQYKLPPLPPQRPTNILPPLPPLQSEIKLPPVPIQPTYIPPVSQVSPSPNSTSKSRSEIHVPAGSASPSKGNLTDRSARVSSSNTPANEKPPRQRNASPQVSTNESKGLFRASVDRALNGQNNDTPRDRSIQEEFMDRGSQRDDRFVNGLPGGLQPGMSPTEPSNSSSSGNTSRNNSNQPRTSERSDRSTELSFQRTLQETEILSSYGYNVTNTTEKDAVGNLRKWLEKIQQSIPNLTITRFPDTIFVKSSIAVKLPRVSQANVATLVDPNGKIMGEPELIRSTGYSKLDLSVIEEIKKRSFRASGKYEVYMYQMEIDQNGLPSPSGTSSNS